MPKELNSKREYKSTKGARSLKLACMFQKKFDSPTRQAPKLEKLKLVVYNPNTKKSIIDDTTQYTEEELPDFPVKGESKSYHF